MAETNAKPLARAAHNEGGDEFLVKKFSQGDDSVFDRIVKENCDHVAALANRLLGWPGDVEDVVQDVFLAAFLKLKKFRCQCTLKTWLFTITINKCRSYRYKRMIRLKHLSKAMDEASSVPASSNQPMDAESLKVVRQAIKSLPSKYREPIVLRYLQGLATEQICKMLGISKNNFHVRLNRARKRLKTELADLMVE